MEEKQKGDDGDDIKENEEELRQHGEKKAQTEDDEAKQKDSVTIEQDNGKDNKEKDSVKRLPLKNIRDKISSERMGGGDSYLRYADVYNPPPPAYCPFNWAMPWTPIRSR